jgi:membrane protein implicated in regulation of membrane protease activity
MDATSILDGLKKIDWAISLLASIPLSILANILTPSYLKWRTRKSVNKRRARAADLQAELASMRRLKEEPGALAEENYIALFQTLTFLGFGSALAAFPINDLLSSPFAAVFFLMSVLSARRQYIVLRRCQRFAEYESSINEQITALSSSQ